MYTPPLHKANEIAKKHMANIVSCYLVNLTQSTREIHIYDKHDRIHMSNVRYMA
jgi:hypothetical protein